MNQFEKTLVELDKGDYDNFTDKQLLAFELMRDFKVSSTVAGYIAFAFLHYKDKNDAKNKEKT